MDTSAGSFNDQTARLFFSLWAAKKLQNCKWGLCDSCPCSRLTGFCCIPKRKDTRSTISIMKPGTATPFWSSINCRNVAGALRFPLHPKDSNSTKIAVIM